MGTRVHNHLVDVTDATDLDDYETRQLREAVRLLEQARGAAIDTGALWVCELYAVHLMHLRIALSTRD